MAERKSPAHLVEPEETRGLYTQAFREFRRNRGAFISLILLIAIILSSIFASYLTPYDPLQRDTPARLSAPPTSPRRRRPRHATGGARRRSSRASSPVHAAAHVCAARHDPAAIGRPAAVAAGARIAAVRKAQPGRRL